jgi:hypothetical protein
MAQDITSRHCSIYDVPRSGINLGGGTWGGHVIEFCDVFATVQETGDHGSFNSWGRDRFWPPSAFKLDDGSSNYEIRNNLCLRGGIKNREGFGRVVENNVIVRSGFHPHVWYKHSGDIFRRNIVGSAAYLPARMGPPPWGAEMDYNLVHTPGQTTPAPAARLAAQSGRDAHSLAADAGFLDPERGDFRVRDDSPALKLCRGRRWTAQRRPDCRRRRTAGEVERRSAAAGESVKSGAAELRVVRDQTARSLNFPPGSKP